MKNPDFNELETLFLALGDKTRLKLLTLMAAEPVAVGYLCDSLGESQPKVSRHLAYLRNAGIVSTRREGKHIFYGVEMPTDPYGSAILSGVLGSIAGEPREFVPSAGIAATAGGEDIYEKAYENYGQDEDETYESGNEQRRHDDELEIYLL